MPMKAFVLKSIKLYQKTRVWRPRSFRFYPSCSDYAAIAVERFGLVKGLRLTTIRLCKCHPLHPGGIDDVPSKESISG